MPAHEVSPLTRAVVPPAGGAALADGGQQRAGEAGRTALSHDRQPHTFRRADNRKAHGPQWNPADVPVFHLRADTAAVGSRRCQRACLRVAQEQRALAISYTCFNEMVPQRCCPGAWLPVLIPAARLRKKLAGGVFITCGVPDPRGGDATSGTSRCCQWDQGRADCWWDQDRSTGYAATGTTGAAHEIERLVLVRGHNHGHGYVILRGAAVAGAWTRVLAHCAAQPSSSPVRSFVHPCVHAP